MSYYKIVADGYITGIGVGDGGVQIPKREYDEISSVIRNHVAEEGKCYRLRTDLTYEEYEPEPEPEDSDKAEAYDILMGVTE